MVIPIFFLIIGLGILIAGAEAMVRGAASLAVRLGVPSLVIGLTIVAFGTSAPELVVNMYSAFQGSADIAIGNIIGSNIVNILLGLGLSALFVPLFVQHSTVWKEIPLALLGVVLVFIMGNDVSLDGSTFNGLTRTDGLVLMGFFLIFFYYIIELARSEKKNGDEIALYSRGKSILLVLVGIIGLFLGGKLLVENAITLGRLVGLSELFIGLTIVAIGTSLPEIITSALASVRGHNDIAIGNVVGSNIFNVFWILGLTSTLLPLPFNVAASIDTMVAIGVTSLLFFVMFVGKKHQIGRAEGITFILLYCAYVAYLVLRG